MGQGNGHTNSFWKTLLIFVEIQVKLGQLSETETICAPEMAGVWVRRHPGWVYEGKLLKCPYS